MPRAAQGRICGPESIEIHRAAWKGVHWLPAIFAPSGSSPATPPTDAAESSCTGTAPFRTRPS